MYNATSNGGDMIACVCVCVYTLYFLSLTQISTRNRMQHTKLRPRATLAIMHE